MRDCCVIAVDGPAGSGKSSAARGVARRLGLGYLDTGAMYRAVTWWLLAHGHDTTDPVTVAGHVRRPAIELSTDPSVTTVTVDGVDVSGPIRTREVSNAVSVVASVPEVRAHLVDMQRAVIARSCEVGQGIVAEGRDIGTVVAPDAGLKVFLTAGEEVRARRRSADLAADPSVTTALTRGELNRRDATDAPQTAMAADAVEIDSSELSLDEVIEMIVGLAGERGLAGHRSAAGHGVPFGRSARDGGAGDTASPAGLASPADAAWLS